MRECKIEQEVERRNCEGIGSRIQVVVWAFDSSSETSSVVTGSRIKC